VFDHVGLRVSDFGASERFYRTVFEPLGIEPTHADSELIEWDEFAISPVEPGHPVTRAVHIGFAAGSRELADEFWRAGTGAGYRDDGAPGPRPEYGPDYYGAFLLDPDGNSVEAVHHSTVRQHGLIDHVWIRVADVAASKRFYEAIAEHAGIRLADDQEPDRAQFRGASGSFSVVAGKHLDVRSEPTQHLHMAFPGPDNETVDAFHAAAIAAGYRDNGAPGERPHYHPGYYGAFVLDPDGNNIEVVSHNR
jgi:catechol 2,3-dioxygenase-like lactoylglutathione lyase family enzyme